MKKLGFLLIFALIGSSIGCSARVEYNDTQYSAEVNSGGVTASSKDKKTGATTGTVGNSAAARVSADGNTQN